MPEIKEPEKPKEEEAKKKACEEPEKYPKEEKAEAVPHWVMELSAKIDKLADALIRSAAKPEEVKPEEEKPENEKKADAYPEPPEEEKPKKEEGKVEEPEKYPYGKEEEKFNNMVQDAIKIALGPAVEKELSKRLVEEPIEKRAKAVDPNKDSEVDISPEALHKMSFREVEVLAKRLRGLS